MAMWDYICSSVVRVIIFSFWCLGGIFIHGSALLAWFFPSLASRLDYYFPRVEEYYENQRKAKELLDKMKNHAFLEDYDHLTLTCPGDKGRKTMEEHKKFLSNVIYGTLISESIAGAYVSHRIQSIREFVSSVPLLKLLKVIQWVDLAEFKQMIETRDLGYVDITTRVGEDQLHITTDVCGGYQYPLFCERADHVTTECNFVLFRRNVFLAALAHGKVDIALYLLQRSNTDINLYLQPSHHTALAAAISCNLDDVVRVILRYPGVDVNKKTTHSDGSDGALCDGASPLYLALTTAPGTDSALNIRNMLFRRQGIDINDIYRGRTILHQAVELVVKERNVEIVTQFLRYHNLDVNKSAEGIMTVIDFVLDTMSRCSLQELPSFVLEDMRKVLDMLLSDERFDVNSAPLLHYAVVIGDLSLIERFLAYDHLEVNNYSRKHPIFANWCAIGALEIFKRDNINQMVDLLLSDKHKRIEINDINGESNLTLLHLATRARNVHVVRKCLERGDLDINTPDSFGLTALHYVLGFGQTHVAKPFFDSTRADTHQMVNMLLAHPNIDMNVKCCAEQYRLKDGWVIGLEENELCTLLELVAFAGHGSDLDIFQKIATHRFVDANVENSIGETVLLRLSRIYVSTIKNGVHHQIQDKFKILLRNKRVNLCSTAARDGYHLHSWHEGRAEHFQPWLEYRKLILEAERMRLRQIRREAMHHCATDDAGGIPEEVVEAYVVPFLLEILNPIEVVTEEAELDISMWITVTEIEDDFFHALY